MLLAATVPGGSAARADQVKLDNGDLIHGDVLGADAENLRFKAALGETEMTIPLKDVVSIETDKVVRVKMLDDSVLYGKLSPGPQPKTATIAYDPTKGPAGTGVISLDRIAFVNDSDWVLNGRIALGLTVQDGNTRSKTLFGSVDGELLSKQFRIELHAYYAYGVSEDIVSTKKGFARSQFSYYFYRPFYFYVGGAFEYDHLLSLDMRSRGGGGGGWAIVERKDLVARLEAGVEYVNEDWHPPTPDDHFAALRLAGHFEWQALSVLRLAEDVELLPNTEHFRDFTMRSNSSATLALWKGFGLAGIVIWQHQELPPDHLLRDDTTYILTLTYVF
jgi:putative salt-induced outer membrane protein YdiY